MIHDTRYDLRTDRFTDKKFQWQFSPWTPAPRGKQLLYDGRVRRVGHGLVVDRLHSRNQRLYTSRLYQPRSQYQPSFGYSNALDNTAQTETKNQDEQHNVPPGPVNEGLTAEQQQKPDKKPDAGLGYYDPVWVEPGTGPPGHHKPAPLPPNISSKYRPDQVLPQVLPEHRVHATLSAESYHDERSPYIDGWFLVSELSDKNFSVYVKGDTVIMAIRGTVITELGDLFNDLLITINVHEHIFPRVGHADKIVKLILDNFPNVQHLEFTGHSLGGAVACELARMYDSKAIVFNSAAPPTSPVTTRNTKIYPYHIVFDLISAWNINNRLIDKGYRPFDRLGAFTWKIITQLVGLIPFFAVWFGLFTGSMEAFGPATQGHSLDNFFVWGPTEKKMVVQWGYTSAYGGGQQEAIYRPPTEEEISKATNTQGLIDYMNPLSNVRNTTEENLLWTWWAADLTGEVAAALFIAEESTGNGHKLPTIPGAFEIGSNGQTLQNEHNLATWNEFMKFEQNAALLPPPTLQSSF